MIKYINKDTVTSIIPVYTHNGIDYRRAIVEGDTLYYSGGIMPRHLEVATKINLNQLGLKILHVGRLIIRKENHDNQ